MWGHLHDTIHNTTLTAYRKREQRNVDDWFEACWAKMEPVTAAKRKAIINYKQVPSTQNLDALRAAKSKAQWTTGTMPRKTG